jgi:hypothetical protein
VSKYTARLPGPSDRTIICGQTGSGKTFGGVWLLSRQDIDVRPWIVLDFKNDDLINSIKKCTYITYSTPLPSKPGIYILKCAPGEDEELSAFFFRVLQRTGIGIYVDEGLVIGQHNKGFNTCLTQGRSLEIPMIILTQRPVRVSSYAFSEATFWMVFFLIKISDRKIVADDTPLEVSYVDTLAEHESYWYDVKRRRLTKFIPVPDEPLILAAIDAKAPKPRRTL